MAFFHNSVEETAISRRRSLRKYRISSDGIATAAAAAAIQGFRNVGNQDIGSHRGHRGHREHGEESERDPLQALLKSSHVKVRQDCEAQPGGSQVRDALRRVYRSQPLDRFYFNHNLQLFADNEINPCVTDLLPAVKDRECDLPLKWNAARAELQCERVFVERFHMSRA